MHHVAVWMWVTLDKTVRCDCYDFEIRVYFWKCTQRIALLKNSFRSNPCAELDEIEPNLVVEEDDCQSDLQIEKNLFLNQCGISNGRWENMKRYEIFEHLAEILTIFSCNRENLEQKKVHMIAQVTEIINSCKIGAELTATDKFI